jgi:hypothetical protein
VNGAFWSWIPIGNANSISLCLIHAYDPIRSEIIKGGAMTDHLKIQNPGPRLLHTSHRPSAPSGLDTLTVKLTMLSDHLTFRPTIPPKPGHPSTFPKSTTGILLTQRRISMDLNLETVSIILQRGLWKDL